MKVLIDVKGINNRFKVVKKNDCYYLYSRKFYIFWVSDGNVYESKQDAIYSMPY